MSVSLSMMHDAAVALLLFLGGAFSLLAGVGLVRMPDLMTRMQAATKAGTLGVGLIAVACAVHLWTIEAAVRCGLIVAFLFLTAPVGAHLLARAAHRRGTPMWDRNRLDDLASAERHDRV